MSSSEHKRPLWTLNYHRVRGCDKKTLCLRALCGRLKSIMQPYRSRIFHLYGYIFNPTKLHYDTSGILRVLFGNGSGLLRVVFFDMMTLSCLLLCDIMLHFVAICFLCGTMQISSYKVGDFFVRAEKKICTRTKYFFYVMQIFLLRIYVLS